MIRGILTFSLCFVFAGGVTAADIGSGERNKQPIQIKSNMLTTDSDKRTATFTGKVVARQADVTIYCDRMIIYYSEQGKQQEVDKIEGFGNVRILQADKIGVGGHGTYLSKEGKIILDDHPKVYQGEDEVSGKVITYFLDTERSEVTSDPDSRVLAIIHPKEKGKDGNKKP
jgi:lipopolysaccharide export system protein LptA